MAVFVDEQYLQGFIDPKEREYLRPFVEVAHDMLHAKKGAGNDFLGCYCSPCSCGRCSYCTLER